MGKERERKLYVVVLTTRLPPLIKPQDARNPLKREVVKVEATHDPTKSAAMALTPGI
jgi:hypothetical protein